MGQRLNIEITNGKVSLANCYYHWSAYTDSALELTSRILETYQDFDSPPSLKMAVELLKSTGAGIDGYEMERIKKNPDRFGHIEYDGEVDRDKGLIAITEEGKGETRYWEEGRVTIDLKSKTIQFNVFNVVYPDDEYYSIEDKPEVSCDFSAIPFDEIDNLVAFVDNHPNGFRVKDDDFAITWIY